MADGAPGNPPPVPDDPVLKQLTFEQLAQLVNEVSPEVFYQRAEAFERASARLQDAVEQVRRQLNIVRGAWTGGGADDFDALAKEVTGKVTGALQTMNTPGYGSVLRAAGDTLAAHQRRMRDLQGRKTEDDSKPPAPGAPSPEQNARVHGDSARQILLDLRTAYWDVGNQLPALSYKDTRIGGGNGSPSGQGDPNGQGNGHGGNGNNGGHGGNDLPLVTNALLLSPGGPFGRSHDGGGGRDGQGGQDGVVHWKSHRPERHTDGFVTHVQQPWRTAGPEQGPAEALKPIITQPGQVPFVMPLGGGPGPAMPDSEQPEFLPPVLGKPDPGQRHGRPEKEHRPDKKKAKHEKKPATVKAKRIEKDPVVQKITDGPAGTETHPVEIKKTDHVQTTTDSPKGAPPVPVRTVPVEETKVVTSTGEPVTVTTQPPPVTTQPPPVTGHVPSPGQVKSVQFNATDGQQAPPVTQSASFGAGGGGGSGSASGAFKPEDRGMFTPGSGDTSTFQGLDASAAPAAHAPASKPGHNPADPMTSQPGGMPMSPMMMGGMAGMGGQGGQQNSRMAAMPAEPRPDAWPSGSSASGTLGRREQNQHESTEFAEGEAKAKLAEKFAELDRLTERGKQR
ncbi:WXG100 family type VII secretion target [Amycolatopsis samaneae]|uniref:WXG100 family type VII secretion target n=1 Tax=Amycolatopsis samaneae TaxID=664691 RepID=A0ABW5GLA6_9PSEU